MNSQTAGQNVVALLTAWHAKEIEVFTDLLGAYDEEELRACVAFLVAQSYASFQIAFWGGLSDAQITDLIQQIGVRIA